LHCASIGEMEGWPKFFSTLKIFFSPKTIHG
jgi:hypothetical protein